MQILTVAQMREKERAANAAGLSYSHMMHNAGSAAAEVILQQLEHFDADRPVHILILAGPGNNGGDGLVCARVLHDSAGLLSQSTVNLTVQVYMLKSRNEDDPLLIPLRERGVLIADAGSDMRLRILHQLLSHADVIVDALLGTGVSRPIDGTLRDVLNKVRTSTTGAAEKSLANRPLIVALDGVTGMDYDTGALDSNAVPADITVTFHAPKRGHYCFPAARANGELLVVPIGIENLTLTQPTDEAGVVVLVDSSSVQVMLPRRSPDANKGTHGKVVIVGGCSDYSGAPILTATAAYRSGAGLVSIAVPRSIQTSAAIHCREATFITLPGTSDCLSIEALPRLLDHLTTLDERHGLIVGPGMGQDEMTHAFLVALLGHLATVPGGARMVVDADGLNHLATIENWPVRLPSRTILTPHPGEMARLAGVTVKDIQSDRIGNALNYSHLWGHVVVLKGAYTIIAQPDGYATVLPFANPALAVAGTGDVLAGCIGAMLAQGLDPFNAAVCGAYLHAAAGEQWRQAHGEAGLLASDLFTLLPDMLAEMKQ